MKWFSFPNGYALLYTPPQKTVFGKSTGANIAKLVKPITFTAGEAEESAHCR